MAPQPQVVAQVPFTAAAHEHIEQGPTRTVTLGASEQVLDPIDVPAYGYARSILIHVQCSGGVAGTLAADGPWNLLSNVTLQDVNGANIVQLPGYNLMLANWIGGYRFPRSYSGDLPDHVGSAPNPSFMVRVPIEVTAKDGMGSLANQNSAANFKLLLSVAPSTTAFSVAPTTQPTVTIRTFLEAWTVPAANDSKGRPQAQYPPLLGTGQFHSQRRTPIVVGNNTIPIARVGNLLRNVVFVTRNASGARDDTVIPDPFQFTWDGSVMLQATAAVWRTYWYERLNIATASGIGRPTGVYVLPFGMGGGPGNLGNETPDLWLPTAQSSRLEITGSSATAGSVEVLTNDIAPVEIDQVERYQSPNDTNFKPAT